MGGGTEVVLYIKYKIQYQILIVFKFLIFLTDLDCKSMWLLICQM